MKGIGFSLPGLFLRARLLAQNDGQATTTPDALTMVLADELDPSMKHLAAEDGLKPYYLCYGVTDVATVTVRASLGALRRDDASRARVLDVDLRVGDYELDNTHQIRGGADAGRFGRSLGASASLPIENNPIAVKHALWQSTRGQPARAPSWIIRGSRYCVSPLVTRRKTSSRPNSSSQSPVSFNPPCTSVSAMNPGSVS